MLLINADELVRTIDELREGAGFYRPIYEGFLKAVKNQPTIDAVPVIRCAECAFSFGVTDQDGKRQLCCTEIGKRGLRDDDYCSFGKRRKQHED